MVDSFGAFADSVQGATLTFLKSKRSESRWDVRQLQLSRSMLQFGVSAGAGLLHGVTDSNHVTLLMQVSDFDSRVWLDGVLYPSCGLIVMPPGCHFTLVWAGAVTWFSLSLHEDDEFSFKAARRTAARLPLKTDKTIAVLSREAALRLKSAAEAIFSGNGIEPAAERALCRELENSWQSRVDTWDLPNPQMRAAEQIVFRALQFVQSRPGAVVNIGDLVENEDIGYRTFLRAFEKYLKLSPKRYLKIRQANAVYHAIRKCGGADRLADILSAHGVSEFGRFAGEYKAIFGEVPSVTHLRFGRNSNDV